MNKYLQKQLTDIGIFDISFVSRKEVENYPAEKLLSKDGYDYICDDHGLTPDEIKLAVLIEQTKSIRTIKYIIVFYLVMSILIGVIATFIYLK